MKEKEIRSFLEELSNWDASLKEAISKTTKYDAYVFQGYGLCVGGLELMETGGYSNFPTDQCLLSGFHVGTSKNDFLNYPWYSEDGPAQLLFGDSETLDGGDMVVVVHTHEGAMCLDCFGIARDYKKPKEEIKPGSMPF